MAASTLLGLAALHAAWGVGSPWPMADRVALADAVAGTPEMPPPAACFAVAGALTAAAGLVAAPARSGAVEAGRLCLAAGFAVRGLAGLAGRTRWLVPWTPSAHFERLDRRFYGPGCLVLAAAIAQRATSARVASAEAAIVASTTRS